MVVLQYNPFDAYEAIFQALMQLHERLAPNPLGGLATFTLLLRYVEVVFPLQSATELFDCFSAPFLSDAKTNMSRVPTVELISKTLVIELHVDLGHHMVGDVLTVGVRPIGVGCPHLAQRNSGGWREDRGLEEKTPVVTALQPGVQRLPAV